MKLANTAKLRFLGVLTRFNDSSTAQQLGELLQRAKKTHFFFSQHISAQPSSFDLDNTGLNQTIKFAIPATTIRVFVSRLPDHLDELPANDKICAIMQQYYSWTNDLNEFHYKGCIFIGRSLQNGTPTLVLVQEVVQHSLLSLAYFATQLQWLVEWEYQTGMHICTDTLGTKCFVWKLSNLIKPRETQLSLLGRCDHWPEKLKSRTSKLLPTK